MNNAEKFKATYGIYATEMWSMYEDEFLKWLNASYTIRNCTTCMYEELEGCEEPCLECKGFDLYEPMDEPQTEREGE